MKSFIRTVALAAVIGLGAVSTAGAQTTSGGLGSAPSSTESSDTAASTTAPSTTGTGDVSTTKSVKLTRSQTKSVQRRIHVKADGAMGSRTRKALKKYQGRKDLKKTGRPNLETLRAMKLKIADQIEAKLRATASGTDDEAAAPSTTTPAPAGSAAAAIAAAKSVIGTPYVYGGNDASGFDCSGLTVFAFKKAGISLPRTSFDQFKEGTAVEKSAIQPGDLVFFDTAGSGASHVGIATSATTAISATTKGVMEHQIDDDYWGAHFVGARRVAG